MTFSFSEMLMLSIFSLLQPRLIPNLTVLLPTSSRIPVLVADNSPLSFDDKYLVIGEQESFVKLLQTAISEEDLKIHYYRKKL